jgi:hypothetical protein
VPAVERRQRDQVEDPQTEVERVDELEHPRHRPGYERIDQEPRGEDKQD